MQAEIGRKGVAALSSPQHGGRTEQELPGLAGLPGLEPVAGQLAAAIAVIRAEQARRKAGIPVARRAWKNIVFTGGPGTGKSRAAAAAGRIYRELGVLSTGHLTEVAATDLAGVELRETVALVREAAGRGSGGVLMITDAHALADLAGHGQQVLRCLHSTLTDYREHRRGHHPGRAGGPAS